MKHALVALVSSTILGAAPVTAAAFDYAVTMEMDSIDEGQGRETFLRFMETKVKPAMDDLATDGYQMCDSATVGDAYAAAHSKVRGKVQGMGGIVKVKDIVDRLNDDLQGQPVTLATLPQAIRNVDASVDRYDLANFLGLACGGGVRVDFAPGHYALNVHYDVTEQRSGRSFGVSPTRKANDASDKAYLDDLQDYAFSETEDLGDFYRALLAALLTTDGSGFGAVAADGQTVLTDFLAVYIAEQARNLMDGHVSPHWDAALLEVTMLAAFHAGQSEMRLYYRDAATGATTFTSQTKKQRACAAPTSAKAASLNDYWQFSRNINDPDNCRRSGINITSGEFRKLGTAITQYIRQNKPAVYQRVKAALGLTSNPTNFYNSLSKYLIGNNAPRRLVPAKAAEVAAAYVELQELVTAEADAISAGL